MRESKKLGDVSGRYFLLFSHQGQDLVFPATDLRFEILPLLLHGIELPGNLAPEEDPQDLEADLGEIVRELERRVDRLNGEGDRKEDKPDGNSLGHPTKT